jgi:hypothetical protein
LGISDWKKREEEYYGNCVPECKKRGELRGKFAVEAQFKEE